VSFRGRHTFVIAALLGSIAIVAGLVYHRKHRVPCFVYVGKDLAQADFDALAQRPGWQARPLNVNGGARVRGLVRKPSAPDSPWILFFGGNSSHLIEDGVRFLDAVTSGRDWGGAVWAYRGYDGSSGTPGPNSLPDDAFEAYSKLVRDEHVLPERVHLVGFSLGTTLVAAIAARGVRPASLTLLAPATELDMRPRDGTCRDRFETLKYLEGLTSPALVIHGSRDGTLPISGARLIVDRVGQRARLIEHPDLGHLELPETPAVIDEVRAFVAAY